MQIIFIIIAYLSFICLGLGTSIIGVAWPAIQQEMGLPVSYGGYISTFRTLAVIMVCYFLGKLLARFGIAKVCLLASIVMLVGWLGFAVSPSYGWLLVSALPLGLGAGALDSGLNDFMAQYYSSTIVNWLHSFFGLGAIIGPLIVAGTVSHPGGWRTAYFMISGIQVFITLLLIAALPLWKKVMATRKHSEEVHVEPTDYRAANAKLHPIKMPGMGWSISCFFLYCGIETCIAMWTATWLIQTHGMDDAKASGLVSIYFFGIMISRILSGVAAVKLTNHLLLRISGLLLVAGGITMLLGAPIEVILIILGLGSGPFMPVMLHDSPRRFGAAGKTNPVGFQMSFAFVGGTVVTPIVGMLLQGIGFHFFPAVIVLLAVLLFLMSEGVYIKLARIRGLA